MKDKQYKFIWRCSKCSNHLLNVVEAEGVIKQEKKCSKCKAINYLSFQNDNLSVGCNTDPERDYYLKQKQSNS